jgi:hypothetical protein
MTTKTPLGPNVRRLLAERAAQIQVEAAKEKYGKAGVGEIAALLASDGPAGLQSNVRQAFEWLRSALAALRRSPGAEQWADDEAMAGEIVRQIKERRNSL